MFNIDLYLNKLHPICRRCCDQLISGIPIILFSHWSKGSEWIQLLTLANVTRPCTEESFLSGSHVKRTRYDHHVTDAGY